MTLQGTDSRWIELDGAVNARVVVPGVLLRSDNLQSLTERDIDHLVQAQGLQIVLDLRTEVELVLEGPGPLHDHPDVRIEHHSLYPPPAEKAVAQAPTVTPGATKTVTPGASVWPQSSRAEEFQDEPPLVRSYLGYIANRPDSIVAAIREIANAEGAVLVHCAAGKDRTGTVVALALDAAGVDREAIAADYMASVDRIEEIFARLRGSETYRRELEGQDPHNHAPVPGTIERVLEVIDAQYGGAVAFLEQHGLTDRELERLRTRIPA
jgi:hypothetical protein